MINQILKLKKKEKEKRYPVEKIIDWFIIKGDINNWTNKFRSIVGYKDCLMC